MRKMVRSIMAVAALAALCLPFQASAATLTDWENLGLPGLTLDPLQPGALFFQSSALTNNTGLHSGLDFGLVMYEHDNLARFAFVNFDSATVESSITDIYFSDSNEPNYLADLLDTNVIESDGPEFSQGVAPPNVGGTWAYEADMDVALSADSDSPVSDSGIESSDEWVVLGFGMNTPNAPLYDYDYIYDEIINRRINIAMHVQAITRISDGAGGGSDWFEWAPSESYYPPRDNIVVPVPAAAGLGFLGMALVGMVRRKKS